MKKIIIGFLIILSSNSFAEKEGGNGGISYVCRNETGEIISARLLDLWEPETFKSYQNNSESVESQIDKALKKIDVFFPDGSKRLRAQIQVENGLIFKTHRQLPLTNDALPRYYPEAGCKYEQVARHGYNIEINKDVLEIDLNIFENIHFSNSDKAALMVHEAMYSLARESGEKTSDKVRILVAKLFSDQELSVENKEKVIQFISENWWLVSFLNIEDRQRDFNFNVMFSVHTRSLKELSQIPGITRQDIRRMEKLTIECSVLIKQSDKIIFSGNITDGLVVDVSLSANFLDDIFITRMCTPAGTTEELSKWSPSSISVFMTRNHSTTEGIISVPGGFWYQTIQSNLFHPAISE